MAQPKLKEQTDAYTAYSLLGCKKHIRELCQKAIEVRENEIELAGNNASPVMTNSYLGYRMGIEDLYYGMYGEALPEVKHELVINFDTLEV